MPNSSNGNRTVSRRQWLGALGFIGATALAGCMGDEDEPVDHENGEDSARLNYMRGGDLFADLQWNQFGDQHNVSIRQLVDTVTALNRVDGEIVGLGFTDWDYDADSRVLAIELRDDITFWNGDTYDAEDYWALEELLRLQNPDSSNYESVEITGDYTVEIVTKEPLNEEIVLRSDLANSLLGFGMAVWEEWLEQYQAASDQEARDEITADLATWSISTERLVEEGLGTGPYIIEEITDQHIDFVAYEDHPGHAGREGPWNPNIDSIRMWYADESGRQDQFILNERVDYAGEGYYWDTYKDALPEYWEQVSYAPLPTRCYKLLINWRNREYLQDIDFRRAMAAAMDYENQAINTNQLPIESHTGLSTDHNKQYWGSENPDEMIDYGLNREADLAEAYLERGGYTREDGTIYDADGEQLAEMRFLIGGSEWGDLAQSASSQLEEFGFPIDAQTVGRTAKLEIIQEDMADWDLSTETHYAGTTQHPHEFFLPGRFWGWQLGPGGFAPESGTMSRIEGWLADGETHSPYNGKPMVFDIPTEVGTEDASGETKEINVYELVEEIQGPVDEERDREIIQDLSWAWNYMLPDIDCTVAVADSFGNTEKLAFAGEDELVSYSDITWPKYGLVRFPE